MFSIGYTFFDTTLQMTSVKTCKAIRITAAITHPLFCKESPETAPKISSTNPNREKSDDSPMIKPSFKLTLLKAYNSNVVIAITIEVKQRLNIGYAVISKPMIRLTKRSVPPVIRVMFFIVQSYYRVGIGGGV